MKLTTRTPTKAQLIERLEAKVQTASPVVRQIFLRGVGHNTMAELERLLKQARVTKDGDITLL